MATTTTPPQARRGQAQPSARTLPGRPGTGTGTRRPVTAPRHTRPASPPAQQARPAGSSARQQRMPFIVLLVGLLGGALVCLLVISTTLAEGSYRITNLQAQNASLFKQEQALMQEVANAQNDAVIEREAVGLGMTQAQYLRFLNPKTGKITSSKAYAP